MNSQILDMRAAIAAKLREALDPVSVEEHPRSRFTPVDISEALKKAKVAVRVAFVGVPEATTLVSNETRVPEQWAVYVVAMDGNGPAERRDRVVLPLVAEILRVVARNEWELDPNIDVDKVRKLRAAEDHEGESDVKGVCIWGVWWLQDALIPPDAPEGLRDFLTLITRYDLAPKDGVIDATDNIRMRNP